MPEIQNPEIFNQEIAELEAKLAAKKQELLRSGVESTEKAVFRQVVKEHASPNSSSVTATTPANPGTPATGPTRTATPQEEQQINALVARAFTGGLAAAVSEAKKTNDPFFIDLLHDRLADEYYEKLVAAHKVNSS